MSVLPNVDDEYDIIVAGGGTSGCVVASRLAAASPSLKILILEAGPPTKNDIAHIQSARFFSHLGPDSKTMRFHAARPSPSLGNREMVISSARCLGGASSLNFAMYTRGNRSDYDDWEETFENPGWGSRHLIPLFKKMETYQIKPDALNHGHDGPLNVSWGGLFTNIGQQYLDISTKFDKVRGPNTTSGEDVDPNDLDTVDKYARWQKWIDAETGKRSDVAHHYIYNDASQQNKKLHIVTGALVRRVLIENHRATGVEFSFDTRLYPDISQDSEARSFVVKAIRTIVISAGVMGSPGILERSGIGRKDVLDRGGVEVKVELDGVGENFQDHDVLFVPYFASEDAETLDAISRNEPEEIRATSEEWFKTGKGLMASNGLDAGIKMRPSPNELDAFGPEFRKRWHAEFANKPDKPVLGHAVVSMLVGDPAIMPARKYFSFGYYNAYPASRGHVHITDGQDVDAPLDFRPGYLDHEADLKPLIWAYKFTREVARRMPAFRGEPASMHPRFHARSRAALVPKCQNESQQSEVRPVDMDTPILHYDDEDDKAVEAYTRDFVRTAWHHLGTCAMKPRAQGGVVDPKLNVYGVEGLKVCDMSICPANVSGNTHATAVVIGEKGATIIGEDLGIPFTAFNSTTADVV